MGTVQCGLQASCGLITVTSIMWVQSVSAMMRSVQAQRSAEAPLNACARLLRRQAQGPHGGFGGRRLQRHHTYSRFRSAAQDLLSMQ